MRHVPIEKTHRMILWSSPTLPPGEVGQGADEPFGEAAAGEADDILRRYLLIKSLSCSPLRDDLELCLAELDALIATARVAWAPVMNYLDFEMEERRLKVIDALQSGYEL